MPRRILLPLLGAVGFATAWWLSSTRMMLELDWDNAAHLWTIDQNLVDFGYPAHIALVPFYSWGAWLAHGLGGNTLDGLRLMNGLAVAAALMFLAATLRAHQVDRAGTLLVCLAWLTSIDTMVLLRTVEDDCLTMATTAGLLWAMRPESGWRRALLVGCGLGVGFLFNYPAIVLFGPVLVWAALAERRSLRMGALRVGAALGGFAAVLAAWGLWLRVKGCPFGRYWGMLTSSPSQILTDRPMRGNEAIQFLAKALPKLLLPLSIEQWVSEQPQAVSLVMGISLVGLVLVCVRRRGTPQGWLAALASLVLVVCSLPAALKRDWTLYERLVHVPLALALLAGVGLTGPRRKAVLAICGLVLLVQLGTLATLDQYRSSGGKLALLAKQHPKASLILISEDEMNPRDYGRLVGALMIPGVRILSPEGKCASWALPVRDFVRVSEFRGAPIEGALLTPGAEALLARQ